MPEADTIEQRQQESTLNDLLSFEHLKPGEELDRIVAEKIMGWLPHSRNTAFFVQANVANKVCNQVMAVVDEWKPSVNIKDAWIVVEKMVADGKHVSIDCLRIVEHPVFQFICEVDSQATNAETAPWAICFAALRSLRG